MVRLFVAFALAGSLVSACAKPTVEVAETRELCGRGWGPARFLEGSDTFDPLMMKAFEHYETIAGRCRINAVAVVGLPSPSTVPASALDVRRAVALEAGLKRIGFVSVDFVQDGDTRSDPQIMIDAQPKSQALMVQIAGRDSLKPSRPEDLLCSS